jgi:hypothetical protein
MVGVDMDRVKHAFVIGNREACSSQEVKQNRFGVLKIINIGSEDYKSLIGILKDRSW